jgi:hypothetical protein
MDGGTRNKSQMDTYEKKSKIMTPPNTPILKRAAHSWSGSKRLKIRCLWDLYLEGVRDQ